MVFEQAPHITAKPSHPSEPTRKTSTCGSFSLNVNRNPNTRSCSGAEPCTAASAQPALLNLDCLTRLPCLFPSLQGLSMRHANGRASVEAREHSGLEANGRAGKQGSMQAGRHRAACKRASTGQHASGQVARQARRDRLAKHADSSQDSS